MIIRLAAGEDYLELDPEQGARIRSLVLNGRERLWQEPAGPSVEPALGWGCFLMAPFVGRLSNGEIRWGEVSATVPTNHGRHAIHGSIYDVSWGVAVVEPNFAVLECSLGGPRWPFAGTIVQRIALRAGQLLLEAEIKAIDPMPAALGWHPWFRRDGEVLELQVQCDRVLRLDGELLPSGQLAEVDVRRDLRHGGPIGQRAIDDVYVEPRSPAVLSWPDLELAMAFSRPIESLVVYTNPKAVCVEPLTAWPDAIRLSESGCRGTGIARLAAGESLRASTAWSWKRRLGVTS